MLHLSFCYSWNKPSIKNKVSVDYSDLKTLLPKTPGQLSTTDATEPGDCPPDSRAISAPLQPYSSSNHVAFHIRPGIDDHFKPLTSQISLKEGRYVKYEADG
ncbi:hypothetical protein QVD17_22583 [Tagetes erecta]|uniref:Uncharacterized protein n=1 Tax=Tagetes erecta TaxID=13708 RepID=A0AAD8KFQ0_TARER|nr:hypothetical protein QVD17_22583 [Tagetes erecta]